MVTLISFTGSNPWSISAWLFDTDTTDQWEFWIGKNASQEGITLRQNFASNIAFRDLNNVYYTLISDTGAYKNKWTHHAYVADGLGNLSLYLDGVHKNTVSAPTQFTIDFIGRGYSTDAYNLHGSADDVRIYNRALSASEIQSLYTAATPTPTPTPPPSPLPLPIACHLYTPTSTIPAGYGVPWDVFSANEMLIKATCQNLTDATLDYGRGVSTQYIYNMGYHYHAGLSGWMPMTLTSTEALISSAWYPRTAQATLTGMDLSNTTHYALGYLCTWTGSQWQCGCRDSACTQSYWQIQSFKR